MVDIRKVVVTWNGLQGMPGYSVFHSAAADDATASLGTFFDTVKTMVSQPCTWTIPSSGDKLDVATGHLTGGWSGGTGSTKSASSAVAYAAGVGLVVRWDTGLIRGTRRFRGRTFIVPLGSGLYATDGTIDNTALATLQTAVNALVVAGKIGVWGRPTTPGGSDGIFSTVTSGQVMDKVAYLKGRRT